MSGNAGMRLLALSTAVLISASAAPGNASAAQRLGAEFVASSAADNERAQAVVTTLSNGRFVVVWSERPYGKPFSVRARLFGHGGTRVGKDFVVPKKSSQTQTGPGVAALNRGGFVIAWRRSPDSDKVIARRFNRNGQKLDSEFSVGPADHPYPFSEQYNPITVEALPQGKFVTLWDEWGYGLLRSRIRGRVYSGAGSTIGKPLMVSGDWDEGTFTLQDATSMGNGKFAVSWSAASGAGILARLINPSRPNSGAGHVITSEVPVWGPARLATLSSNRYVAVWRSTDSDQGGIRAQIMSTDGSKIGSSFIVNSTKQGEQRFPRIASFPDGRFVVVWVDASQSSDDPSDFVVRGQLFRKSGKKMGSEFLVAHPRDEDKLSPDVAVFGNSDFVVTWVAEKDNKQSVRGQVFAAP